MKIVLDTGSLLIDLALMEMFLRHGHSALLADDVSSGFSPDIVLVGNNFDSTAMFGLFPDAKMVVLDIGLSTNRREEAAWHWSVNALLPQSVGPKEFEEAARRIINGQRYIQGVSSNCFVTILDPYRN